MSRDEGRVQPEVDEELCLGCCVCIAICPAKPKVLALEGGIVRVVHPEVCIGCRLCEEYCPTGAIKLREVTEKEVKGLHTNSSQ